MKTIKQMQKLDAYRSYLAKYEHKRKVSWYTVFINIIKDWLK